MASQSFRRPTLLSALLLVLSVPAQPFSFLPSAASSTFPECGLTCTLLQTAQTACVPPAHAVASDTVYISCFCDSSYLLGLKTSGAVCSTCTAYSDQVLLVEWYNGYCDGGYTSTVDTSTTATATTTSAAGATIATAATTTTSAAISTATVSSKSTSTPGWAATHKRWIAMLAVLAVGFGAIGVIGAWYKKRHDARRPGLYHGNDRSTPSVPGNAAAPGFFSGSLRNMSKSNVNSPNDPSTANNSSSNVAAPKAARSSNRPSMSMTSFTRSSALNQNINNATTNTMSSINSNSHVDQMWGPHQASVHNRSFDNITPIDGTAFRNSMAAAAAAAAAFDKGGASASTPSASRTDLSSIGTAGGNGNASAIGVARTTSNTPVNNNSSNSANISSRNSSISGSGGNPNRLSKVSAKSSSTLRRPKSNTDTLRRGQTPMNLPPQQLQGQLHGQQQENQHEHQPQRADSPVSPITDD